MKGWEQGKHGERAKGQRSPGGSEPQMAEGVGISKGKVIRSWSGPGGSAVHVGLGSPHSSAIKTKLGGLLCLQCWATVFLDAAFLTQDWKLMYPRLLSNVVAAYAVIT